MTLEEAFDFLKSKGLDPKNRPIGEDPSVVAYLKPKTTFTVRKHKHKDGVLYGNLWNHNVLAEWRELDETSLPFALEYCLKLLNLPGILPAAKEVSQPIELPQASDVPQLKKKNLLLWISAIAVCILGVSTFYVAANRTKSCTAPNESIRSLNNKPN